MKEERKIIEVSGKEIEGNWKGIQEREMKD